jgi:sterol 3beta-glucosyltransferase
MRIALVTSGTRGDAQPMVVLGAELARRGHDIALGLPPNLVSFGERAGFLVRSVGPDSQAFMESPEGQTWLASGNVKAFMDALGKVVHDNSESSNAEMIAACSGADVIVSGILTEDNAICLGEAWDVPVVLLHSAPSRATRAYANYLVTTRCLPGPLNRATGALFQRIWWRSLGPDVNRFRAELGLAPTRATTAARVAASGGLELQAFDPVLAPGIDDYGDRRPLVGFLTPGPEERARLGEAGLDRDLASWLAAGDAPAYFGFGSMPVTDPGATVGMITRVSERLGLRALISAGWSRIGTDHGDSERVRVVGAVNHDALLPHCRIAVHHGGAGTTAASVAAGVPTVICSVFADQPFWGARLEQLGAGAHLRFAKLDEASLEAGLRRALDPGVTERVAALGAVLRSATGAAARCADLVEQVVAATDSPAANPAGCAPPGNRF